MKETTEQRTLKPNLLSAVANNLLFGIVIGAVISTFSLFLLPILAPLIGFITVVGFVAPKYLNIRSREYRFEEDQMEWYEGFLTIKQRNISYDRITDISLEQPITQRPFGTGTIKVNTAGSSHMEIKMSYIDNPDQEYKRIKQITGN